MLRCSLQAFRISHEKNFKALDFEGIHFVEIRCSYRLVVSLGILGIHNLNFEPVEAG